MAEVIDYDKVTTLLLRHGEWYEVDPGTLTPRSLANWSGRLVWSSIPHAKRVRVGVVVPCGRSRRLRTA